MKLTYYLFKSTVKKFEDTIISKKVTASNNFEELKITNEKLNFETKVFIQRNKTKEPKWLKFLENDAEILDKAELKNTVNSFIIILKIYKNDNEYFFGITGGMGFTGINKDKLESDFGLKVTLNCVNPSELKAVDVRNIDIKTRQKRIHINKGSRIDEFEFDFQQDIINLVSGKSKVEKIGKNLRGTASLNLDSDIRFEILGDKCRELLDLYQSEDYKEEFDFIDNMKLIKSKELKNTLFMCLWESIGDRDEKVILTYPDMIEYERCTNFKLMYNSKHKEVEDLDIKKLYDFLDELNINKYENYEKVKVVGLDEFGTPVTTTVSIKEFIVYEIKFEEKLYIFTLNDWYYIEENYYKVIQEEVNKIALMNDGFLHPIKKGESEGSYNERHNNDYFMLMDKDNFQIPKSKSKIEVCDLFSKENHFVCVKRETSSATLSHLFAQGSVSMDLLRNVPEYREKLTSSIDNKFKHLNYNINNFPYDKSIVVYAISTDKGEDIRKIIPFFSKVNLLQHVKRIKELGMDVRLFKIPIIK
ncbi:hypothetical protein CDLVIII_5298 [Clostridium sp. DL-VIII]|uniref:DUF6119 family protein n=1 Tax=Clostridium sp. DL-VIII TaxID=641107 RepID=UPI00023B02E6|nr:DUF6119 family protein [Clostridium sp. DL-VIII]EHJ01780.1 hypothetical protein CDLVIII_5298 [Clostridium sp. DL-VIII]